MDEAVAQLDTIAVEMMSRSGVPGVAIAVVHNDELIYARGFGIKQVGSADPIDEETVFQIASVSKSVGATAIATAVSAGELKWSDLVTAYLPDFELSDPNVTAMLTLGDLYAHRSGLPDHAGDLLEDIGYDREEVFARLRLLPLSPFRASYHYTNFGMTVAGVAAATATGQSWEDFSRTHLYEPLGMTSTSSSYADFMAHENKALGNMLLSDGSWVATPQQRQPDAQSPAGGVSSNVLDMARWMRMILAGGNFEGEPVIAPDDLLDVLTPHINSSPPGSFDARPGFYGYGFNLGTDASGRVRYSHSGGFLLGTGTSFFMIPAEKLGIVVLTNGTPVGLPEAVCATFCDLVENGEVAFDWLSAYRSLFDNMLTNLSVLAGLDPPTHPAPAPATAEITGTYANDYFGPLSVSENAGALSFSVGPQAMSFELSHWDGNIFSYIPAGENANGITAVTFHLDAEGQAESVTIENLDVLGQGTFIRQNLEYGAYIEGQSGNGGEGWRQDKRGNGVPNGLEYAFDRNATSPLNSITGPSAIAQWVRGGLENNQLALSVSLPRQPPSEVVYVVYASDRLAAAESEVLAYWQGDAWTPLTGSVQLDSPQVDYATVRDHLQLGTSGQRFMWLGVTQLGLGE
ncbi:serine hydrolase [Ruficoccus amylovorans]|uniref:Serine hydrolase n=1 Tax=Ruficoccus amylovorans TaxID=1804625 RepID=A0A842HE27_9BACT|nr:serine hydrolase [Ruficoccus amylovorans]